MEYTEENIDKVAQKMVDDMGLDDLMAYVYDDVYALMVKDEEAFHINAEYFDPE